MNIEKIETANKMKGRAGHSPRAIVIHCTEGSAESAISWIKNTASQVSYHYMVKSDGQIVQFVEEEDTAWANGLVKNPTWEAIKEGVNPNLETISIAFAGFAKAGPTIEQFASMARLIKGIGARLGFEIDKKTLIGHNRIRADKICPGTLCDVPTLGILARLR